MFGIRMWLLGIAGITISIGPSLYHVLKPLREALRRAIKWVTEEVLIPLSRILHEHGVFEAGAWCCVLTVTVRSVIRSAPTQWGSSRFPPLICAYAPWGVTCRWDGEIKKCTHHTHQWRSIRFRVLICAYAPWGAT